MGLRILLVSDHYPPFIGGAHRQTQLLAHELQRNGHTVNVVTAWSGGLPDEEEDGGVHVYRLKQLRTWLPGLVRDKHQRHQPPFPDPITTFELRRIIKHFRPDIVHTYGWFSYSSAAALLGMSIPLLISARDYGYSCATRTMVCRGEEACSGPSFWKCMACAADLYGIPKGWVATLGVSAGRRLLNRKVTGIHSISTYVQDITRRDFLKDQAHARDGRTITEAIIPSFREDDTIRRFSDDRDNHEYLDQLPSEKYILYVGALRRVKGVNQLLEAYTRLASPPPLVLIGTLETDSPREFPRGVLVLQNFPHRAVMTAWDRCLFGVFPSLWPEPLGSVVYEGMSRGKAVIGTTPGGHTDMISPGETGLLVPAGDVTALAQAMRDLIDQPALCERLGGAAKERARLFTASVVIPQFERVYQMLINRSAGLTAQGVDLEMVNQARSSRG